MDTKKIYTKPTIQYVDIITNDLCAASACNTIDINTSALRQMQERHKTYSLKDGASKDMWDTKF